MRRGLLPILLLGACSPDAVPMQPSSAASAGIVSLNPCTDAILLEVAAPQDIAALSHYSSDPASSSIDPALARRFPATGGTVEEIVALRPRLVIGSTFTPPATRQALARLGIPLAELPIAASVDHSFEQVREIATLSGHPERGEALAGRIGTALAAAAPAPGSQPISAVVWQSGGIVPGEDTLIADLLRRTGFSSHSAARGLGQADQLPLERMLADPPAVILAAGNGHAGEDRLLAHAALAQMPETKRFSFDPALLWCGGPTIIRAAARLAEVRRSLASEQPVRNGFGS